MREAIDVVALGRALVSEPPAEDMPRPMEDTGDYDERTPGFAGLVDAVDADYGAIEAGSRASFVQRRVRHKAEAAHERITAGRFSGRLALAWAWAPHVDNWRRASLSEGQA